VSAAFESANLQAQAYNLNYLSSMMSRKFQEPDMSQKDDMKAITEDIQAGLKKLGGRRVVALSVHKTKELVAELESKIAKLAQQIDSLS
jgi:adenylate kinase